MKLPKNKLQRKANALIFDHVEEYREAARAWNRARDQANFDKKRRKGVRPPTEYLNPEAAMNVFARKKERAAGALEVLKRLFPELPAWTETKWLQ
jgi:hypothetical protein